MAIILEANPRKTVRIKRSPKGGGVIRIDEECCEILEQFLDKLNGAYNVKELASALIKGAADDAIIKMREEGENE